MLRSNVGRTLQRASMGPPGPVKTTAVPMLGPGCLSAEQLNALKNLIHENDDAHSIRWVFSI